MMAESIVNGANGGGGSFLYPNTSMLSWLCSSDTDGTYNNSAPEGWLYYAQIGAQSTLPQNFSVISVGGCSGPEGVVNGNVSNTSSLYSGVLGQTAIVRDMSDQTGTATQICQNLH